MLTILRDVVFLRAITFLTIASFLPCAAGAWNYPETTRITEVKNDLENPWSLLPWETSDQTSAPRWQVAQSEVPLNVAKDISSESGPANETSTTPTESSKPVARILLAKYTELANRQKKDSTQEKLAQADAPSIPSVLSDAETLYNSRAYGESALLYLEAANESNTAANITAADRGLVRFIEGVAEGSVPLSELDSFEASRPADESLNMTAHYYLVSTYVQGAMKSQEVSNKSTLDRLYPAAAEHAVKFCADFPRSHYIQSAYEYRYDLAKLIGPEKISELAQQCENTLDSAETSSTMSRIGALQTLVSIYTHNFPNTRKKQLYSALLAASGSEPFANSPYFQDETIPAWTKSWIAFAIGQGCRNSGELEKALRWFSLGREKGAQTGRSAQWLGYHAAATKALLAANDPYAGILAYDEYLRSLPDNYPKARARAYCDIALLYMHAGDYASAREFYEATIANYPGTDGARVAEQELSFLSTYLDYSVQVAGSQPNGAPLVTAQLCGPFALQRLLALKGVKASIADLAVQSDCGPQGASMLGLAKAASKLGVPLLGIQADTLQDVPAPFIAYVSDNHFLLVKEVSDRYVVCEGINQPSTHINTDKFAKTWSGKVLIIDTGLQLARTLSDDELALLVGGGGDEFLGIPGDDDDGDPPNPGGCETGQEVGVPGECKENSLDTDTNPHPSIDIWYCDNSGCHQSPTARLNVRSQGVHPVIRFFESALQLQEEDIGIGVRGPLRLAFRRAYINNGFLPNPYVTSGKGWTNNFNYQDSLGSYPMNITRSLTHLCDGVQEYDYMTTVVQIHTPMGRQYVSTDYEQVYNAPTYWQSQLPQTWIYEANGLQYVYSAVPYPPTVTMPHDLYGCDMYDIWTEDTTVSASCEYRLTYVYDKTGNSLAYNYDGTGRLEAVEAPGSDTRSLDFSYDASDRITKVQLMKGSTELEKVDYEYNGNGELTKVIDDNENYITYTYDSDSGVTGSRYLSSITDKNGETVYFEYAYGQDTMSNWHATKITANDAAGLTTVFDRSISTNVVSVTNWDGTTLLGKMVYTPVTGSTKLTASSDYYYDTTNYQRVTEEYDSAGNLTKIKGPSTATLSEYAYDSNDRLTAARRGAGPWTSYAYTDTDALEYASEITGPDGLVTEIEYDSNGLITKVTHPSVGANGTRWAYDAYGQVTTVTDPADKVTTYVYNSIGNLTSVTDPNSSVTTFAYDDFSRVTSVTDPRTKVTDYEYAVGGCSGCGGGGRLTKVIDAEANETTLGYDQNGNLTTVTDALSVSTGYEYDALNHLTKIISPSGSAVEMTMAYDILGHLTARTDFEGKTTYYDYDHLGRVVQTDDGVGTVMVEYSTDGQMTKVIDGNSHEWAYAYDTALRLTSIVDPVSKYVKYFYNTYGQLTKVGAGSSGTFDPTEYEYSATTGLMTKVKYWTGANHYDANYAYDSLGRVSALTDWISTNMNPVSNGLRYGYDNGGRLTSITDYDDAMLTYEYDAAGNVTLMTDYHDNETAYTYTDRNQLSTLTAPGNKVWSFDYNALGQPTDYDIPNGMTCNYGYDTKNRLTAIEYKDGATVLDGFYYELDDTGNITKTTDELGGYWDYLYDDRYRLTDAVLTRNAGVRWSEEYTYDDGDNMLTKKQPWSDLFNSGVIDSAWTTSGGNWSVSNDALSCSYTGASNQWIRRNQIEDDITLWFSYKGNTSYTGTGLAAWVRRSSNGAYRVNVNLKTNGTAEIVEANGGTGTVLASCSTAYASGTWYDVCIKVNGANIEVWKGLRGGALTQIMTYSSLAVTASDTLYFQVGFYGAFDLDDMAVVKANGDPVETVTFAVNNANELSTMTDPSGTTTFGFDDWGRMTTKARGSYAASYDFKYGQKLESISSNWPGESNIGYEYASDLRCYELTVGSQTSRLRWADGYTPISSETTSGVLNYLCIGRSLAKVTGSDPVAGYWNYTGTDQRFSIHSLYDSNRAKSTMVAYGSFGQTYRRYGGSMTQSFIGYPAHSTMLYAPYRLYIPELARWLTRDPFPPNKHVNLYTFVENNPISNVDIKGDWIGAALLIGGAIILIAGGALLGDCMGTGQTAFGYWGTSATPQYQQDDPNEDVSAQESAYREFMRHCGAACEITHVATGGSRCVTWSHGFRGAPTEQAAEKVGATVPLPTGGDGSLASIRGGCDSGCKSRWNAAHPEYQK